MLLVSQHWGKLIGKQGEVHCSIPRVQKGDMTVVVKDGASIETQWLMQLPLKTMKRKGRDSCLSIPYKGSFSDFGRLSNILLSVQFSKE